MALMTSTTFVAPTLGARDVDRPPPACDRGRRRGFLRTSGREGHGRGGYPSDPARSRSVPTGSVRGHGEHEEPTRAQRAPSVSWPSSGPRRRPIAAAEPGPSRPAGSPPAVAGTVIAATKRQHRQEDLVLHDQTTSSLPGDASTTPPSRAERSAPPPPRPGPPLTRAHAVPGRGRFVASTTQFAGPPPTCSAPAPSTTRSSTPGVGDIKVFLNSQLAPGAVNNFIVLARYPLLRRWPPLTRSISRHHDAGRRRLPNRQPAAMPG